MATDTTLVQGAYDANKYRGQAVDAAQRRLGDNLNETVGKLAANKRAEKEALEVKAEEAIARGVGEEDKEQVKGRVLTLQDEFIDPNTTEQRKQELQEEIAKLGTNMKEVNEITGSFAESVTGQDISAGATTEQSEFLNHILSDGKRVIENPDKPGEFGFDLNGGFISTTKANKMLSQTQIDVGAQSSFGEVRSNFSDVSNKDTNFQEVQVYEQMEGIISKAENKRSLFFDPMFGNTSMVEDMKAGDLQIKYTDTGLSEEEIEKLDTDGDGVMTGADTLDGGDQGSVIDSFMESDDFITQRETILAGYLTEHVARNWRQAYKKEHGEEEFGEFMKKQYPTVAPVIGSSLTTPGGNDNTPPPSDDSGEVMIG